MPDVTLQLIVFVLCVGAFTAAAAVWDWRYLKIPNALTVPVFGLGLVYQIAFNGWGGLGNAGLGFLVGFSTLFVLWIIGGGGGGDVKLMGALGVWLGLKLTLMVLIVSTIFVAIGTVLAMAWNIATRRVGSTRKRYLATGRAVKASEPDDPRAKRGIMGYSVPIALATWIIVLLKLPEFPFVK